VEPLQPLIRNLSPCSVLIPFTVEQELPVPFHSQDRRVDALGSRAAQFAQHGLHFEHGCALRLFIPNNSALSHQFPAHLKLGLHENDDLVRNLCRHLLPKGRDDGDKNQGGRDEGNVHGDKGHPFTDLLYCQVTCVRFFKKVHPRIVPEAEIHLAVAGVHGNYTRSTMLLHAICKSAGRSSDIQTDLALQVDVPVFQSAFQFDSAAADIAQVFTEQPQGCVGVNCGARFLDLLLVDQDFSSEDQRLRTFARGYYAPFHQQSVESRLHVCDIYRDAARTRCGAECRNDLLTRGYKSKFALFHKLFHAHVKKRLLKL
jgi:hypothetical protein